MEEIEYSNNEHVLKLKKNVELCQAQNQENIDRFNRYKDFVLRSTSNSNNSSISNTDNNQPDVSVNIIESIISRMQGEFSKHIPNMVVDGINENVNPMQVDIVEGISRNVFGGFHFKDISNDTLNDIFYGGFGCLRVLTDYETDRSYNQVIKLSRVPDPTYVGFDNLSVERSKHDAQFCYEIIPKSEKDLKEEYPDIDFSKIQLEDTFLSDSQFRWYYTEKEDKIYNLIDYYEKKNEYITMYEIDDFRHPDQRHSIEKKAYKELIKDWKITDIEPIPRIHNKVKRKITKIWRYKFISGVLLEEPEETDFDFLPLIFVDGNSVTIKKQQITRPITYNTIDAQRGKDLAFSMILKDMINSRSTDVIIAKSSIPVEPEYESAWKNPQRVQAAYVYEDKNQDGTENPPPSIFPRGEINPAFFMLFDKLDNTIQMILGSYDSQLGIQNNQISGQAIRDGACQSNNASMPYITNFIASLNQAARVVVSLIPKYYKTMRTVPVILSNGKRDYKLINDSTDPKVPMMNFNHNDLLVNVEVGANFDVQRQQSMDTMIELMKVMPSVNALMNEKGLPWMLDNIELRGKEHIKQMAEEFIKEQQQKSAEQKNPEEEMMRAQIEIEKQKLQLIAQKQQMDSMLEAEKLKQSEDDMSQKQRFDLMTLLTKYETDMAKIENDKMLTMVRIKESQNEADRTEAELQMKRLDSEHNKVKGMIEGAMKMRELHESRQERKEEREAKISLSKVKGDILDV